jgi:hypothetical protein
MYGIATYPCDPWRSERSTFVWLQRSGGCSNVDRHRPDRVEDRAPPVAAERCIEPVGHIGINGIPYIGEYLPSKYFAGEGPRSMTAAGGGAAG